MNRILGGSNGSASGGAHVEASVSVGVLQSIATRPPDSTHSPTAAGCLCGRYRPHRVSSPVLCEAAASRHEASTCQGVRTVRQGHPERCLWATSKAQRASDGAHQVCEFPVHQLHGHAASLVVLDLAQLLQQARAAVHVGDAPRQQQKKRATRRRGSTMANEARAVAEHGNGVVHEAGQLCPICQRGNWMCEDSSTWVGAFTREARGAALPPSSGGGRQAAMAMGAAFPRLRPAAFAASRMPTRSQSDL